MFYEYENEKENYYCTFEYKPLDFPLHIHQVIELVHVIQGEIVMQIGPKTYTLKPGQLALVFPNVVHNYHTLSEYGETLFYILNCNPNLLPYFKKDLLKGQPANPILDSNQIHTDFLYAEKRSVEVYFCAETVALCSSLASLMLSRIFPYLEILPYESEEQGLQDLSGKVISYIGSHFTQNISLENIANHFGIGKYSLSRIFSNVLHQDFNHYLNSLRINYAKHLLTTSDYSITRISVECAYNNQQTFNRVFKEFTGTTPKEYRKKFQSDVSNPILPNPNMYSEIII